MFGYIDWKKDRKILWDSLFKFPGRRSQSEAYPWLQIDLGRPHRVTSVWVVTGNQTITNLDVRVGNMATTAVGGTVMITNNKRCVWTLLPLIILTLWKWYKKSRLFIPEVGITYYGKFFWFSWNGVYLIWSILPSYPFLAHGSKGLPGGWKVWWLLVTCPTVYTNCCSGIKQWVS